MLNNNGNPNLSENYKNKFFSSNVYTEIINIFFTSIASLVFLIYFLSLTSCIMKNPWSKTKSLIIFWIDFFLVLLIILIICAIYLFCLIFLADAGEETNIKAPRLAQKLIDYSLLSLAILFNSIMTIDIINNFKLSKSIYTLLNVKGITLHEIGTSLKGLCLYPITSKKSHSINLIIICSFQMLAMIILFIFNIKSNNNLLKFGLKLLKFLIIGIFVLVLISRTICNYYKSLLLEFTYHNKNLVILKLYNSQANYALYLTDIISYKVLIDLLGSIPLILFSFIGRLHTYAIVISYLCLFGYIVLSGSLYITIDKNNSSIILTDLTRTIFFYRKIPFILDNDVHLYDELDFELNEEEALLFGEVDHTFFRDNVHLQLIENAHFGSAGLFENSNERLSEVMKMSSGSRFGFRKNKEIPLLDKIEINTPENYYIVCKMMYLYFEKNQGVYMEHEKKMEEEAAPIQKLIFSGNANDSGNANRTYRTNMNKTKEYISGLDRFSKLSKTVEKKFTVTYKTGFNNLFSSLEEKEYRESFRKRYAIYEPSKSEFKIESLFNNDLLELFPFYQIHVKDLLNSLEPGNNKEIFVNLSNQKESVSLLSSTSGFYTYDSFLFFEIYDANDFSIENLRTFVNKYKEYLIEVVKNMDFTFLPIIVGMYIITILGNDKLIILYRHPLSSTQYSQFTQWINFIVTEEPESIKVSTEGNSIIDINEIEIKNNIKLPTDQYQELKSVLQNDIHFIVHTLQMETFPIANLFVGTGSGDSQCYMMDASIGIDDSNYQNDSGIGGGGPNTGKSFNVLLRDHTLDGSSIGGNMMVKKVKKEGGSELISLFEKDYMIYNSNNHYTLKLYFTNFFRKTCVVNEKEDEKHKLSHEVYCVYVQDRLLNYFHERKDLFKMNEFEEMENIPKKESERKVFFFDDNGIN